MLKHDFSAGLSYEKLRLRTFNQRYRVRGALDLGSGYAGIDSR